MEALKAKYNTMVLKKAPSSTANAPQDIATANATPQKQEQMDEIARMKAKFNKAYNLSTDEDEPDKIDSRTILQKKQAGDDDELAALKAKFKKATGQIQPEDALQSEPVTDQGFTELEEEVRDELEDELVEQIKIDLQKELMEDVKKEVANELEEEEKNRLNDPSLEKEIKSNYEANLREELKNQLREEVKAELREEWKEKIKDELRKALYDEVKTELRRELREEVKNELRQELKYQIKLETESEIRQQLEQKLKEESEDAAVTANATIKTPSVEEEPFAPEYREVEQDIVLVPLKVGEVIPMNNIFFDSNQATLKEESFTELERVLSFLKSNPQLIVEVGGHTNGWCSHSFANELSDKRANKVMEYFVESGISPSRIQYKGYGKTKPIASNDNAAGRRKNQRVELKILEILD